MSSRYCNPRQQHLNNTYLHHPPFPPPWPRFSTIYCVVRSWSPLRTDAGTQIGAMDCGAQSLGFLGSVASSSSSRSGPTEATRGGGVFTVDGGIFSQEYQIMPNMASSTPNTFFTTTGCAKKRNPEPTTRQVLAWPTTWNVTGVVIWMIMAGVATAMMPSRQVTRISATASKVYLYVKIDAGSSSRIGTITARAQAFAVAVA
mmetsp:Transcript_30091/g.54133  ORF Transcript_30091/g.54133 Transcript_30091/m.54133 type:complete len:202 (+) Transcript_30091:344-949(+)